MRSDNSGPAFQEQLLTLRNQEAQVARRPTAEAYLELAASYQAMGLDKESDRLVQLAESLEGTSRTHAGLLCGTATPMMIIEVIQIVTRTTLNGELTIETQSDTFHLYFDEGRVINASSQAYPSGFPSFRMALRVSSGTYRFVERSVDKVPRLLDDRTDILLLSAIHDTDKEAAATTTI